MNSELVESKPYAGRRPMSSAARCGTRILPVHRMSRDNLPPTYSICIKVLQDDARSTWVCKGAASRPTGGSSRTTFTARSCVCSDFDRLPVDREADAGVGNFAEMLDDQAVERFRAVQAEIACPSRRLSVRSGAMPSTTTLPSARGGRFPRRRAPAS